MAHYTLEETVDMIQDSDIELESESEIEEDPAFPLPSLLSDDEDPVVSAPTCTQQTTPSQGSRC